VSLTVAAFLLVMFVTTRLQALPRSTLLIDWFRADCALGRPRLAYRLFKDRGLGHILERARNRNVPVLLISAKDGADTFIREMRRDPSAVYRVVGVLADTPSRVGSRDLPRAGARHDRFAGGGGRAARPARDASAKADHHRANLPGEKVRRLLDRADALAIPLARLPKLTDFQRNLDNPEHALEPIALEDLLGRPQAVLDRDGWRGSFADAASSSPAPAAPSAPNSSGRSRPLAPSGSSCSITAEFALYGIEMELRERFPALNPVSLLRDVRARPEVDEVIAAEKPEILFHAAALKHLPMVEANPIEVR